MLSLKNLSKFYNSSEGQLTVLNDLSLKVSKGESLAILGESGSGKSTLLHIIAGLEKPTTGLVRFQNMDIWASNEAERAKLRREKMAVIFQQFNLIPSLSIKDNIEFHSKIIGTFDPEFVQNTVKLLKLEDILNKYPEQTSGGQQQRTAIARAIAAKPLLILADEPTGNLDEKNTTSVIKMLNKLVNKEQTTLLVATHSQTLAASLKTQVILKKGKLKRYVV